MVTISDIDGETLFLTSLQMKMQLARDISHMARVKEAALTLSEEVAHFPIIANLIAAGCGIGFLPDYIAKNAALRLVHSG